MTADVFAALGEPSRWALVQRIAAKGPISMNLLGDGLGSTRQAIAKHLTVLEEAGVVRSRKLGRERVFSLESQTTSNAARGLHRLTAEWDARLAKLKDVAEALS